MNHLSSFLNSKKIGFIGSGYITQALCKGLVLDETIPSKNIYVTNRTPHKAQKLSEELSLKYLHTSEELLENCETIFLAVKPADFCNLLDEIAQFVTPEHHIISLAAGINLDQIKKSLSHSKVSRLVPNTAVAIKKGVIGIFSESNELSDFLLKIFERLGTTLVLEDEEMLNSLLVATSSGIGFALEIMSYFSDWLESHGFTNEEARKLVDSTFAGAGLISSLLHQKSLENLISQVSSKKGVTLAGLESMRSLELDRVIRMSLDSAQKRNEELARLLP